MIITDENSQSTDSPRTKSSALPSTSGVERREESQGPAPPSYNAATSMTSSAPHSPLSPSSPYPYQHPQQGYSNVGYSAGPHQPLIGATSARRLRPTVITGYENHLLYAQLEEQERLIKRRTRRRFFRSLCVAVFVYLLLSAFIGSLVESHVRYHWPGHSPAPHRPNEPSTPNIPTPPESPGQPEQPEQPEQPTPPDTPNFPQLPDDPDKHKPHPSPRDGDVVHCTDRQDWSPNPPNIPFISTFNYGEILIRTGDRENLPFAAYRSFYLPMDVEQKLLFSRGRHASGSVVMRAEEGDVDKIRVDMRASYAYAGALDYAYVCEMKKEGYRSLGIYTTNDFDGTKDIRFFINVIFPRGSTSSTTPIGNFSSSLSWFDYLVDTRDDVSFDQLTLVTSSDKIQSTGVLVDHLMLSSSNGAITGSYNVTKDAVFTSSNAPIELELNVHNEQEKSTSVVVQTSNGRIIAKSSLWHLVNGKEKEGGSYEMKLLTKNGPVEATFPDAPVDSKLDLTISTSNAPVNTHLNPTYEGAFSILTSNGSGNIHYNNEAEDPSGRGRKRFMILDSVGKFYSHGWIGWGERKKAGSFAARTSNGMNTLWF